MLSIPAPLLSLEVKNIGKTFEVEMSLKIFVTAGFMIQSFWFGQPDLFSLIWNP